MVEHFLRHVREENWFLFLKHSYHRASARNFGTNSDCGSVRFPIELKDMQTFSVRAQDVQGDSMDTTTARQNAAQAVQDGFDGGLIGHGAGRIQQSSISIFDTRHMLSCDLWTRSADGLPLRPNAYKSNALLRQVSTNSVPAAIDA